MNKFRKTQILLTFAFELFHGSTTTQNKQSVRNTLYLSPFFSQQLNRNLTDTGYRISSGYQLNELLVGQGEGHHFPAFPSMQLIKLIRHPLV